MYIKGWYGASELEVQYQVTTGYIEECGPKTHPNLICPTRFGEVAYPFNTVIVAPLEHLQKANNQPRRSEHQDLEVDVDWRASPDLSICRGRELSGSRECTLLATLYPGNPGAAS